jgi:RNA polymerase sigma-70 factor (ECF subfamily)
MVFGSLAEKSMSKHPNSDLKPDPADSAGVLEAFVRHEQPLRRFIGRFLRNTADVDDVAQEAFLRAFSAERKRPIEQPKSFIFRIAKHIALTQLTRKARQITSYIEDSADSAVIGAHGSSEDEVIGEQSLAVHCEAVARLPPQCRQVYLLRKVHGLSHKEIAQHLGIAVSTVEKHLIKGLELCDRYVRDQSGEAVDRAIDHPASELPAAQRRERA